MASPFNKFFDDIVCINLLSREDKYQYTKALFVKLGIAARFHRVKKHKAGGRYGCFLSHITVIKDAYENNKDSILVFEDDILPSTSYSLKLVNTALDFLEQQRDWEVFYFGYIPSTTPYEATMMPDIAGFVNAPFVSSNILKFKPIGTHAYCLKRNGMRKILQAYSQAIGKEHFDIFVSKLDINSYCIVPMLFEQRFCMGSDNSVHSTAERIGRKSLCFVENNRTLHNISYFKYGYDKYIYISLMSLALICFGITALIFLVFKNI